MLKIGITGGIGSGKSTISRVFATLGTGIYDADSRAKWLMCNDSVLKSQIIENFGEQSYSFDGELNRVYLGSVVFSNPEKTKLINGLVHPRVGLDFETWIKKQSGNYIIKEAALLIDSGSYKQLDKIILVKAPETLRIQRVLERDPQRSKETVRSIIDKQMSEEDMEKYTDYVIDNSGNKSILKDLLQLHQSFSLKN
ncbi:dephospho-CoA kinase [Hyphobacterium sp. CCMP332]|nr:dephospho-CoA kinase [Hyphobacterium sp. CCMP332]